MTHMCKFCTCALFLQFTFLINIPDMPPDNSSVLLKQTRHLGLRKPYGIILQPNINGRLTVLRLIDYYLILFHNNLYFGQSYYVY